MYPFATRTRWLLSSRYGHLLMALGQDAPADSLVVERMRAIRRVDLIHAVVGYLMLLSLAGAAAAAAANIFPQLGGFWEAIRFATGVTGGIAGALTLTYLLLTRTLNQLEADLLGLMLTRKTR